MGPGVILCDFFAKIDFFNSIDTVVLCTNIMGF